MSMKEELKGQTRNQARIPRPYQVILYNDDFTPMDFVVAVLMQIFEKDQQSAVALMLDIHHKEQAVAGVYPRDIAQTKASQAVQWARECGYPLKAEAVCQP